METPKNNYIKNISKSDFNNICRTCLLQKGDMLIIHQNIALIKILHTCTRIKIGSDDGLPSQLCNDCFNEIEKLYKFKKKCEKHDKILRKIHQEYEDKEQISNNTKISKIKEEISNIKEEISNIKEENSLHNDIGNYSDYSDLWKDDDSNSDYVNPTIKDETVINSPIKTEDSTDQFNSDSKKSSAEDSTTKRITSKKNSLTFDPEKCDEIACTCKICNKSFYNLHSLARHMEQHNENRKFSHTCKVCNKGFYELGHLTTHMRRHDGNKRYKCEFCNKGFYELSAQAVHMKKHNVEPMPCDKCDKKFLVKLQLEIHKKTHEEFKHFCPDCGKGFAVLCSLKKHSIKHKKDKPFMCQQCNRCFKQEFALRKHIKVIHEGIKERDVCNVCGKSVARIKYHMLEHYGGEKKFKCNECPLAFDLNCQLTQHVLHKHRGEKPTRKALCTICGFKCYTHRDLEIHMRKHTGEKPLACTMCEKKYKTPAALRIHVRTHTNERPYICSVCGKGFYTSTVLKNHVRIHTGERPFVCQLCHQAFTQKSVLQTHMKTHS